jgi:DMSO/TMAO reductase YedYZ heme-binding membrane subunit
MVLSSDGKYVAVIMFMTLILGLPAIIFVLQDQTAETNLLVVLRTLGRISFIVFLLIVVIRPLHEFTVSPFARTLMRNRRYIGIVLASSMTVYLGFIVWRLAFVLEEILQLNTFLTGGQFYSMLYFMLITSFNKSAAALGPKRWRTPHRAGF